MIASTICFLIQSNFSITNYIDGLIHFNICPPFYYVFLYIQLLVISPIIYQISKSKRTNIIINLFVLLLFSYFSTNYTDICGIYGGGGKLFGSTYTICLILGMYSAKNHNKLENIVGFKAIVAILATLIVLVCYVSNNGYKIDSILPFGYINPPGIFQISYAYIIFLFVFIFGKIIELKCSKSTIIVYKTISKFGQHTLYIFLYHFTIIQLIKKIDNSSYIVRLMSFIIIFLIPIVIECVFKIMKYGALNIKERFD